MLTSTTSKPAKIGRLEVRFTGEFVKRATDARVDLSTFELLRGGRRIPLVGQREFLREAGRPLPRGHVFWTGMALAYRPVEGVLKLHYDGRRFDWGHFGKKADEDQSLLYARVKTRLELRGPFREYQRTWRDLERAFQRLSPDERRARGDAAQLECAGLTQHTTAREERAISNYLTAAELTYGWKQRRGALTVHDLQTLNRVVVRGESNNRARAGRLRDFEASITDKPELQYVPVSELRTAMGDLVDFMANSSWTDVEIAASAYQRISSIHPFADGNGRTGRLLMNGLLHRAHLPPVALRGNDQLVAIFGTHARGRNFGAGRALAVVTRGMRRAVEGRLVRRGHGDFLA